jgi:histidine phosphotransfer protein HptB
MTRLRYQKVVTTPTRGGNHLLVEHRVKLGHTGRMTGPAISKAMIERYLERRRADLEACRAALERAELGAIEGVGHRLKGTGASFGFEELGRIGAELEAAAARNDLEGVGCGIANLERFLATPPGRPPSP